MIHYLFSKVNPYVTISVQEIENKNCSNNIEGGDSMNKLHTITAEDLQNRTYEPTHFLVDELIPEGLHILAGAPKIGKSWLALWLCLCVSQGQPLWNFTTVQGDRKSTRLNSSHRSLSRMPSSA